MREKMSQRNTAAVGLRKLFSLWGRTWLKFHSQGLWGLSFFCLMGSYRPSYGFLGLLLWYFPRRNFTPHKQSFCCLFWSALAGHKANKTVSKPSRSQLPSLEEFRAGKGKASQAGFREQSWTSKGADKWAKRTSL